MTELAAIKPGDRVLEIGTGSGYQAAVLAELGAEVYSIEIVEPLASRARETLRRLGYDRVKVRHGDGYRGWPQSRAVRRHRGDRRAAGRTARAGGGACPGGRLVIPVGSAEQELKLMVKTAAGLETRSVVPVRFVPMVGGP